MKELKPGEIKLDHLFQPFAQKMEKEGLAPIVIDTFRHYFGLLVQGETGRISKKEIDPVKEGSIADSERLLDQEEAGQRALGKTVVIKLNGGLGTSMGLFRAKSLLEVKNGLSFLDIMARQVLTYRKNRGVPLPLVFMNSFGTEDDTLRALAAYPDLSTKAIPLTFVQHKVPKVLQEGLAPAVWPKDPALEWNPPGHGNIFRALATTGILARLLDAGIRYAFISNSDNLGAVMDETILGYFAKNRFPFMMEVTDRTGADRKGGHLARLKDGRFTLREIAQCPEEELEEFQDVGLYRFFNTNTIWVNLEALQGVLDVHKKVLPLAMIRNPKTVDFRDESSPPVFQLETAMGSAISLFEGAAAIRVPRARFIPVKKCQDLLGPWSDASVLTEDYHVLRNPKRGLDRPPSVQLDPKYYSKIDQLKARFPHGAPSLLECASLNVEGDVLFGEGVKIKGSVVIANQTAGQVTVPDGKVIAEDVIFS